MIQTRRLTKSEATGAIVFYFSSVTAVISLMLLVAAAAWPEDGAFYGLAAGQRFVIPSALEFAGLAAIGLLGGCGQIMMTHCYRFADASVVAAFDYVSMIWAAALGYLVFAETPTPSVLTGSGVVVAAGIALLWREHQARQSAWRPAPAKPEERTNPFDIPDDFGYNSARVCDRGRCDGR